VNHQAGWPSDSPHVLSVGGTNLTGAGFSIFNGYQGESAWSGTGGGISNFYAQPIYQQHLPNRPSTTRRMAPDVAFVADSATGVNVYDSYNGGDQTDFHANW